MCIRDRRYFIRIWAIGTAMAALEFFMIYAKAFRRGDGFYPQNAIFQDLVDVYKRQGTHHCSPGGVGIFDQRGKLCACSEKFNVDQIGAVGGKNGADKMKILFVGQSGLAAFGFCAEGDVYKRQILNGIAIGKLKIYKKKDTAISAAEVADTAAEVARFEEAQQKAILLFLVVY